MSVFIGKIQKNTADNQRLWAALLIFTLKFMRMNELLGMRFLRLLSESSQEVNNEKMQDAYGEFVEQIRIVGDGNDYSTIYRILTATRIEIASLETAPLYGQGEKCA